MSTFISLYVTYKNPEDGKETPLSKDAIVNMFDSYIPGNADDDCDERFNALQEVQYDELPKFLQKEYGRDSGRCFVEMTYKEFCEENQKAIDKYMLSMSNYLSALGLNVDDDDGFGLHVTSGRYDSELRGNPDYSPLTWRIDKKLVLKATDQFIDMWTGVKGMGIARVIRDMVPRQVNPEDIRMILVRH